MVRRLATAFPVALLMAACDSTTEPAPVTLETADSATVMVDSTLDLRDSVSSSARLTWVSLDTLTATVDTSGVVTAHLPGMARIAVAADTIVQVVNVRITARVAALSIGLNGICVATPEGLVFCTRRNHVYRVAVPRGTIDLSAGEDRACARLTNAQTWCWSNSLFAPDSVQTPSRVTGGDGFLALSIGSRHQCGIRADSTLNCWGRNFFYPMTSLLPAQVSTPTQTGDTLRFRAAVASEDYTCGIARDGAPWCWGNNNWDHLGRAGNPGSCLADPCIALPHRITMDSAFVAVKAGGQHNCALTASGQAWCWGGNGSGELGDTVAGGCTTRGALCSELPQRVNTGARFARLALGVEHSCALTATGEAWCWGSNGFSQLGRGPTPDQGLPAEVSGGLRFRTLVASGVATCGIALDDTAWCWGRTSYAGVSFEEAVPTRLPFQP